MTPEEIAAKYTIEEIGKAIERLEAKDESCNN